MLSSSAASHLQSPSETERGWCSRAGWTVRAVGVDPARDDRVPGSPHQLMKLSLKNWTRARRETL